MSRPSIALVGSRGIPARYGGFETFAEELAVRLAERGIDVTVFCEGQDGPPTYRGVKLEYVPAPHLGGLTTLLHDFRALWRARTAYDVVYMLGYGTSLFCLMPKLWGSTVWMNMDGVEWARAKWGFWGSTWWKMMERVASWGVPHLMIADAKGIQDFLASRYRSLPPCTVIPYGAEVLEEPPDPAPLAEWGVEPYEYHLVIARFEPENHLEEIFEGYAASSSPHPLIALGTTRKPNAYTRRLDTIAAREPRLILPGAIYDDRIRTLRYYARTYLHGHSVGGTNPSLLEAMGAGNAVLAHDNTFNREVAGEAARYFTSAQDVARLVDALDADDTQRQAMGTIARDRIQTQYTWERIADRYESLLTHGASRNFIESHPASATAST